MITFHGTFFSTNSKGPEPGAFAHCILRAPILVAVAIYFCMTYCKRESAHILKLVSLKTNTTSDHDL